MRIQEFEKDSVNELNYPGSVGIHELYMFHQLATVHEKQYLRSLLDSNLYEKARDFIRAVTGRVI